MGVIAQWDEVVFEISTSSALLLEGMKITGSCETKNKDDNERTYTNFKSGKAVEVTLKVKLYAALGIDVKEYVMLLLDKAQKGKNNYLIMNGENVFPFKLRLTKAETEEIQIAPNGKWVSTDVNVTFQQGTKEWIIQPPEPPKKEKKKSSGSGGSSGSGSGGSGGSGGGGKTPSTTNNPLGTEGARNEKFQKEITPVLDYIAKAKATTSTITNPLGSNAGKNEKFQK